MKRAILIFIGLIAVAIVFSSCRKCVTCRAYERTTNIQFDEEEMCGPAMIVNDWQDDYEESWNSSYYYSDCSKD